MIRRSYLFRNDRINEIYNFDVYVFFSMCLHFLSVIWVLYPDPAADDDGAASAGALRIQRSLQLVLHSAPKTRPSCPEGALKTAQFSRGRKVGR